MGTCGLIDSDDILACFIAGNAFTFEYVRFFLLLRRVLISWLADDAATGSASAQWKTPCNRPLIWS